MSTQPARNPRIDALTARRDGIVAQLRSYDDQVIERSADLEGAEAANYANLTAELEQVTGALDEIVHREDLISRSLATATSTAGVQVTVPAQPKREDNHHLVYNRQSDHNPMTDLLAMARGDSDAAERVNRHNRANEDRFRFDRTTTVSSLGGLIVPEYLTDEVAAYTREGRPFANVMTNRPLNKRTTTLAAVTTPTAMGMVSSEGTTYTSADYASTQVDVVAKTIGGYTDVSIEAVEFATLDEGALFLDLLGVYNQQVDYQCIQGTDASGQVEGIFFADGLGSVTASSATSGAGELWQKVMAAADSVYTGIYAEPTYVVMSSTRWYFILSKLDASTRPLFGVRDGAPTNVLGSADPGGGKTFANLPVIIDNNIYSASSADTRVIVTKASELYLLEQNGGKPVTLKVDQLGAKQGTVTFVARGFIGFTAERRPRATCIISGLPVPVI